MNHKILAMQKWGNFLLTHFLLQHLKSLICTALQVVSLETYQHNLKIFATGIKKIWRWMSLTSHSLVTSENTKYINDSNYISNIEHD